VSTGNDHGEGNASPSARWRAPVRPLAALLFVVLAAGSVGGALVSHQVVVDQERRLLDRRAAEVAALFSLSGGRTEQALGAAATAAQLSNLQATTFSRTASVAIQAHLFDAMAVVQADGANYRIVLAVGPALEGTRTLGEPVTATLQRALPNGTFVSTPVFKLGAERRLGVAELIPGMSPRTLVYAESVLTDPTVKDTPAQQSQIFGDLRGAVYAGSAPDPAQVILISEGFSLRGAVARRQIALGADSWFLVVAARHPLVGTLAERQPWLFLLAGLLAALLVGALVEVLLRRRQFALALVDERTGQLRRSLSELDFAQQRLVRQERLAAIGQLSSAVGHELRNPLGVLSNVFYLLRTRLGEDDPWLDRQIRTGEREVGAATLIVSDLLEFARPREPIFGEVDVAAILDEVLSVAPPPPTIRIARPPAEGEGVAAVRADRDQLRQVLLNLVTNAYDAMPDGGLLVLEVGADPDGVRITVADTGSGIDDETIPRLFEPFFTTKAKGIGLGLSVAHRIVDAHGGSLAVKSQPGAGASFSLTLPAVLAPAPTVR
jgi:signal transduction histidine kinase